MVRSEELCSEISFRRETRKSGKDGRAARTSPLGRSPALTPAAGVWTGRGGA